MGFPRQGAIQYEKRKIDDVLLYPHLTDAHFTQYEVIPSIGAYRYNGAIFAHEKFQAIKDEGLHMAIIVFEADFPTSERSEPGTLDQRWEDEQPKIADLLLYHPGALVWRTRKGYRVCWLTDRRLTSDNEATLWREDYLASISYFARRYDIHFDPACGDWTRLQRVPWGTRDDDDGPVRRELYGSLSGMFDSGKVPTPEDIKSSRKLFGKVRRESKLAGGQKSSACDASVGVAISVPGVWERILKSRGILGRSLSGGKYVAKCPNEAKHTAGKGGDDSTVLFPPRAGEIYGYPTCSHSHCRTIDWMVALGIGRDEWELAKKEVMTDPLRELGDAYVDDLPKVVGDEAIYNSLVAKDNNPSQYAGTSANVTLLLTGLSEWKGKLAYDPYRGVRYWTSVPERYKRYHTGIHAAVIDSDVAELQNWLLKGDDLVGRPKLNCAIEVVRAGMNNACDMNVIDSLMAKLVALRGTWDRKPRLDRWLMTYFGVHDSPLNRAIGARWLIASVARAIAPGCVADMMIVLEGAQECGKGYCLSILFGDEHVVLTGGGKLGSREFNQKITDAWCVHDDELKSLLSTGLEPTKSWITERSFKYRKAWDRDDRTYLVRYVVVGSTNPNQYRYLQDEENRRFWPLRVGQLDANGLKGVRDQLMAEAVYRYEAGEEYCIRKHDPLWQELAAAHEERKEESPWLDYLRKAIGSSSLIPPFTIGDAMTAIGVPVERQAEGRAMAQASKALRSLGMVNPKVRTRGQRVRMWQWPNDVLVVKDPQNDGN